MHRPCAALLVHLYEHVPMQVGTGCSTPCELKFGVRVFYSKIKKKPMALNNLYDEK